MATDRNGHTVAAGEAYLVCGIVRAIETNDLLLVLDNGKHTLRVAAGDVARVDDKQNAHGNLTALAGLSGAADKLPYFTGAAAMALATLSSFMRTLLSQTSAQAACDTMMGALAGGNSGVWVSYSDGVYFVDASSASDGDVLTYDTTLEPPFKWAPKV